jgi:hypothetical protein
MNTRVVAATPLIRLASLYLVLIFGSETNRTTSAKIRELPISQLSANQAAPSRHCQPMASIMKSGLILLSPTLFYYVSSRTKRQRSAYLYGFYARPCIASTPFSPSETFSLLFQVFVSLLLASMHKTFNMPMAQHGTTYFIRFEPDS